jgi:hypothetical protein
MSALNAISAFADLDNDKRTSSLLMVSNYKSTKFCGSFYIEYETKRPEKEVGVLLFELLKLNDGGALVTVPVIHNDFAE